MPIVALAFFVILSEPRRGPSARTEVHSRTSVLAKG
jgi:hypothetical protein